MIKPFPYSVIARIIASIMLLLTITGIEGHGYRAYGWFNDLRWGVCAAAFWGVYVSTKAQRLRETVILAIIAFFFNPIAKITMSRADWQPIDIISMILLVLSCISAKENSISAN